MGNHFNAPTTKLLNTHCARCGLPLVDAQSVERGIGPVCNRRLDEEINHEHRKQVNKMVFEVAQMVAQQRAGELSKADIAGPLSAICGIAHDLGYPDLAARLKKRAGAEIDRLQAIEDQGPAIEEEDEVQVHIRRSDVWIFVTCPYNAEANADFRQIPGRYWMNDLKANRFPKEQGREVLETLKKHYSGMRALGDKGEFEL
jgi:uncharacterized Zn finger protein (UPF0148 family)